MPELSFSDSYVYEDDTMRIVCTGGEQGLAVMRCQYAAGTIIIPDEVEGIPVIALHDKVFSRMSSITSIVCSENISYIGPEAFSWCTNLIRLVLPQRLDECDASWFKYCSNLEELTLPGAVEEIPGWFMSGLNLRRLIIGPKTRLVDIPPTLRRTLERIDIAPNNPHLSTDGSCLYDKAGEVLLSSVVWEKSYKVLEGCRRIAKEAFSHDDVLEEIELPNTLHAIGRNAFMRSGLKRLDAPSSLRVIASRAFYECGRLAEIHLNDGLASIGDGAFESCNMLALIRIPATVEALGVAAANPERDSVLGSWPPLSIDEANEHVRIDGFHVLYYHDVDGWVAVQATDVTIERCTLMPDTVRIGESAFTKCSRLRDVYFNDGLLEIGELAFARCHSLEHATMPDSVRYIGDNAFYNSRLNAFNVPCDLEYLGANAIVVDRSGAVNFASSHRGSIAFAHTPEELISHAYDNVKNSSLIPNGNMHLYQAIDIDSHRIDITVNPKNERFYIADGIFCEWLDDAHTEARAIMYVGFGPSVTLPDEVVSVCAYAFDQFKCIKEISLGPNLREAARLGFSFGIGPERVELRRSDAEDVHLSTIPNSVGGRLFTSSFVKGTIDASLIALNCDRSLSYVAPGDDITRMIKRLCEPELLDESIRTLFDSIIKRDLQISVERYAKSERVDLIQDLVNLGYIGSDNLDWALGICRQHNCVKAMGVLLEARRGMSSEAPDYDI